MTILRHEHEPDITSPCHECYRLAARAREALKGRIPCTTCGMTGNLDPVLHRQRYGHAPTFATDPEASKP